LPIVLIILIKTEPNKAYQKLSTEKPSTKEAANRKRKAFTTNEKRPRVMIVIGRVSISRIGLIIRFNSPKMMAEISAG
jgi:hypothetical protein